MNELSSRLKSDVIDQWESLNLALTEQVAINPARSEHTRIAGKIAAALHGIINRPDVTLALESVGQHDLSLIREIADASKASIFASAAKKDLLSVTAYFEADRNGKYKFLRNAMVIDNRRTEQQDLLEVVKRVGSGLIDALKLDLVWEPQIKTSPAPFEDQVVLRSPTDAGTSVNVQFFKRNPEGDLEKYDPKSWQFNLLPPA